MIGAEDIRAARAYLGWSQDELAGNTGLSVTTIRNLESGDMSPRSTTTNVIRQAMEASGIEFMDGGGVRRRNSEIQIFDGHDSCDVFFDDMLRTVKDKGGDVISVFLTRSMLVKSCSVAQNMFGRLEPISRLATIQCLLPEVLNTSPLTPSIQFRTVLRQHIGPSSYFIYGNKHATIIVESNSDIRFLVHTSTSVAQDYRKYFQSIWALAPLVLSELNRENTAKASREPSISQESEALRRRRS